MTASYENFTKVTQEPRNACSKQVFNVNNILSKSIVTAVFSGVCNLLGINKTRTTALHRESDGMVERFNRTLENQLAIFVERHQKDLDDHVPLLMMPYR